MTRSRALVWGWLPLLLTVCVRVAWLSFFPTEPLAPVDAEGFHLLAVNMLDGRGFAIGWDPPFCPTAVRTPLYPWFVAGVYRLLGRDPRAVVTVQILLEVLTAAGAMALTRELTTVIVPRSTAIAHSRLAALLAGVLYAINGTTQRFTGYLLSEALLLPLLPPALILTIRALRHPAVGRAAAAAVLWGAILLIKPNGQYLVLAVGALLTVSFYPARRSRQGRWRGVVGAFWGTLLVVLLPWLVRNYLLLGRWTLSTAFDENVARVSAVATQAALQGIEVEPWSETWEHLYRTLELQAVPELASVPAKELAPCASQMAWQRRIAAEAATLVEGNAGVYLRVHLQGVLRSLFDPGHRLWYHVVTGADWASTGVVPDIWARMAWSLNQWAVGDALEAFWLERIWRIPPLAGALWWGLVGGRVAVAWLATRGLRGLLRGHSATHRLSAARGLCIALLLVGTVAYHILLPGPIAHDRFYVPVVPVVVALVVSGLYAVPRPTVRDTAPVCD